MDAVWAIYMAVAAGALAFTAGILLRPHHQQATGVAVNVPVPEVGAPQTEPAGAGAAGSGAGKISAAPIDGRTKQQDEWSRRQHRCDQAVYRSARAVDTVSSASARQAMRMIVRRMDAELQHVRALAQLGRELEQRDGDRRAARRANEQLDDAVIRFAAMSERTLDMVVVHVADPDLGRLHERVRVLREEFPLLRPLSTLVGREPGDPVEPEQVAPNARLTQLPG